MAVHQIGDVVRHKAGGPPLVVLDVYEDEDCVSYSCAYWSESQGEFKFEEIVLDVELELPAAV